VVTRTRDAVEQEIRDTLGLVPSFFDRIPDNTIDEEWTLHTEMARMYGATDEEIQEAVHLAKHTVGWSAYLNGIRQDEQEFGEELEEIGEHVADREPALV
jgi:hypothetical protein